MLHYLAGVRATRTPDVGRASAWENHFAKCGGFLPQSRQRLYSAGRPSVTYSFGSRNPKRIISFLPKVYQSQSLPGRIHFALYCRLCYYGFPLAAFYLLLPMASSTKSPGRRFFQSGKHKAINYPPSTELSSKLVFTWI